MKKTIFGCLGVVAVAFALQFTMVNVHAGRFFNDCTPCDEVACDPCDTVCGVKAGGFFLNGHMEAGFFANAHGAKSTYGNGGRGAYAQSGNTRYLQNTRLTGAQINQVYLSMGKAIDGRRGLDIGGTVDFTWGSDAYLVQAGGMEYNTGHSTMRAKAGKGTYGEWGSGDYFSAFAQAYAEIAYKRWNVIAGKFYAPFGSDSYKSTDNFFYSWSLNNTINPQVGGGAYASYLVSDKLTVIGGWVMPEEIGESSDNNAVLGGFVWTPGARLNVRYAFASGEDNYLPAPRSMKYFVHSLTATTQLNKRLKYVFDWSYKQGRLYDSGGPLIKGGYYYGLNNELIYQLNKKWAFGTRFGMLHDNGSDNGENGEMYTVGVGANWTPTQWLIVKPEVRYDWTEGDSGTWKAFNRDATTGFLHNTYQLSGGMSAVVKF